LDIRAAVGNNARHLLIGFYAFRDRRHSEILTEQGDRTDDCLADGRVGRPPNEGLINLDPVERKA
jgi:hypothetical protein